MNAPRLLLITRRFWPLVGGAESLMATLGSEFRRQGVPPTIVTARWQQDWPAEILHRGVRVVRLPNPALRGWGTLRYMLSLARWLRGHAGQFDLLYVSMLKHDAFTALNGRRRAGWPVILRAEGAGESGDCVWQQQANFGRRIARTCRTAEAIVAPSVAIRDELLAARYPSARIHLIPNGVAIPAEPTSDAPRRAARAALAEANEQLTLPEGARLVVYTGRLHPAKGLSTLVAAWKSIVRKQRDTWLWIVGEGPLEDALQAQVAAAGLHERIVFAGAFDDVGDVLRAADAYVLPSLEEGLSLALLEALAMGLPVVASDIPGNRQVIEHGQQGLLVPPDDPSALAASLNDLLADPVRGASLGCAGRRRVSEHFSLGKMVEAHLTLFQQLMGR